MKPLPRTAGAATTKKPSHTPSRRHVDLMDTRKVYIETYGCQMNLADTELLLGLLKPHGYEPTQVAAQADVILLNTCAIREHAEERVLRRLGNLVRYKARRPDV